jgi:D-serine deaminase-like pyridoxal phosphate-dependent protein
LHELPTPALVIDIDVLDRNISRMAGRTGQLGVRIRPHVKTHKCVEIGRRQLEAGAAGITVSTLFEARTFADAGFDDILWAFPVILGRLDEARALADRINFGLVVDTIDAANAVIADGYPFRVHIKVDSGYHRAGMNPTGAEILQVARTLADAPRIELAGILSHSGHAYHGSSPDEIAQIAEQERVVMTECADRLGQHDVPVPEISVGSTPSMAQVRSLAGVTEARPGNYAFYDFTQVALGSCAPADCAATVVASVVSSQQGAQHCIVDAGALALSKDTGPNGSHGPTMGELYADYHAGTYHADHRVVAVSQEHGRIDRALPVGSRVRIAPNHSCLTAAQFDHAYVARGQDVIDCWTIRRGRD